MDNKIAIIILNWNQEKDTTECLASLRSSSIKLSQVILVDNGSQAGSIDRLRKNYPLVESIKNKHNLGFAEGNNVGVRQALRNNADYILLLNNDTTVEPDFLEKMVEKLSVDDQAGIASPKIMFYQDKNKLWFAGGGYLPFIRKPYHPYYGQTDIGQVEGIGEVEWVSGCCMLIKKEVLKKIGLLDPDYFNNYEDVDFCVRAKKAGFKIMVVPQAKIYHKFAASMGGKFSPFYTYFRTRNNLLFFKKTGQWFPLLLNFMIFPVYSIIESIKNRQFMSIAITFRAVVDFIIGRYGKGSMA